MSPQQLFRQNEDDIMGDFGAMEPPSYPYADTRQRASSSSGLGTSASAAPPPKADSVPFDFQSQLGHMVWEAGTKQVQDTFKSYGRIDLFRPYFDVEPSQVRIRLLRSFVPRRPSQMVTSPDLYGPSMGLLVCIHARIPSHRVVLAGAAIALHTILIFYLHFGFHVMLEEIDLIIDGTEDGIASAVKGTLSLQS
ncbi:hypothetical protein TELCIR_03668 [Teladorsagia circumcincta]|uniref:Uncharacterized protein n=1 Tax=Teladorsagia circumcincta TaxID=45464 RepID=A0A2G9UVR5_TELCI|nr:hypothetical protein TELCIR_03668 [Teladorsagia circumcincta]